MPKLKTRKAAAKRFRITGSGKIMHRKTHHKHLLEHKSTKRKNDLRGDKLVNDRDAESVRLMMPYAG